MPFRELINNNAIPLGALCVGVLSGIFAIIAPVPKKPRTRIWVVAGIPLALAIILNFMPIWDRGSYPSCGWEVLSILLWACPGLVAATLIVIYKEHHSKASSNIDT